MTRLVVFLTLSIVCFSSAAAQAAPTDAQKCEAQKNLAAGKYAACLQKAYGKAVLGGGPFDGSACDDALSAKWTKIEAAAAGACPTTGDVAAATGFVGDHAAAVAAALAGAGFPICTGGALAGGCWFLGAVNQSCDETCAAQNLAYDPMTETYAGSGGTNAQCQVVLDLLGAPGSGLDLPDYFCIGGWGCAVDINGVRARCATPTTDPSSSSMTIQRVCACH